MDAPTVAPPRAAEPAGPPGAAPTITPDTTAVGPSGLSVLPEMRPLAVSPITRSGDGHAAAVRSERCRINLKSTADVPFGSQADEWRNSASIPA